MKAYLSIDIDFWKDMDFFKFETDMKVFFRTITDYKLPMRIVREHHELLDDINHRQLNRLINVDYHSDLTNFIDVDGIPYDYHLIERTGNRYPGDLNCGTWVNFAKMRTEGEFIWIYPYRYCMEDRKDGRCEEIEGFWGPKGDKYHNWKALKAYQVSSICKFDMFWDDIQAVGISLSPKWLPKQLGYFFLLQIYPKLKRHGAKASKDFKSYLEMVKYSSK